VGIAVIDSMSMSTTAKPKHTAQPSALDSLVTDSWTAATSTISVADQSLATAASVVTDEGQCEVSRYTLHTIDGVLLVEGVDLGCVFRIMADVLSRAPTMRFRLCRGGRLLVLR